ncbi:MAG: hypothetical protein ACI4P1_06650 [Erysipelotrichaceae bacterium]
MKKIMIMLMTILLGSICLTSKISAATTCKLEIDGDNLKIVCDEAVFSGLGNTGYTLVVDSDPSDPYKGIHFNLRSGVVVSDEAKALSFTKETLMKTNSDGIITDGNHNFALEVTVRSNESGPWQATRYELGEYDIGNIKSPLPDGLKVESIDENTAIQISCAEGDSCKTYLNQLLYTNVHSEGSIFGFDNSFVALYGGEYNSMIPKWGYKGGNIFSTNESADDYKLVISKEMIIDNGVETNDVLYDGSLNVIGYPNFYFNNLRINIQKAALPEGLATKTYIRELTGQLVIEFNDELPEDYFDSLSRVSMETTDGSGYGFKIDVPAEGDSRRDQYFDYGRNNNLFIISYMEYANLFNGVYEFKFESSLYKTYKTKEYELTTAKKDYNPFDMFYCFGTNGFTIVTGNYEFLKDALSEKTYEDVPMRYRNSHGFFHITFSDSNFAGEPKIIYPDITNSNLKIKDFGVDGNGDKLYMLNIPYEELKGNVPYDTMPESIVKVTVGHYSDIYAYTLPTDIASWYKMLTLIDDVLNNGVEATADEIAKAVKDAHINLDAAVEDGTDGMVVIDSYLAQVIDMINQNRNGLSKEMLGENGSAKVTVTVKDSDVDLTKSDVSPLSDDVDEMKGTDVKFSITVENKYMVGNSDGIVPDTETVSELTHPMEVTIKLPDEELASDEEYKLLTVHKGEKALIPLEVSEDGETATAEIKKFSPFQVVIVKKSSENNSKPANPNNNTTDKHQVYVVNTSVK